MCIERGLSAHDGAGSLHAFAETDAYRDNYRAFASVMMKLGMERSMEVVRTFASEMRNDEMNNVRNLAALLMTRLQRQIRTSP